MRARWIFWREIREELWIDVADLVVHLARYPQTASLANHAPREGDGGAAQIVVRQLIEKPMLEPELARGNVFRT